MLTILWALVILEAAALATVVAICRKELPAHFKSARGGYAIDEGALEGTLSDEVRDINFGGGSNDRSSHSFRLRRLCPAASTCPR